MKSLSPPKPWDPPACRTIATQGIGIQEMLEQVREHGVWLRGSGGLERKAQERAKLRFDSLLAEEASAAPRPGLESKSRNSSLPSPSGNSIPMPRWKSPVLSPESWGLSAHQRCLGTQDPGPRTHL